MPERDAIADRLMQESCRHARRYLRDIACPPSSISGSDPMPDDRPVVVTMGDPAGIGEKLLWLGGITGPLFSILFARRSGPATGFPMLPASNARSPK